MDDSNVVTFRDARDIMENVEADENGKSFWFPGRERVGCK